MSSTALISLESNLQLFMNSMAIKLYASPSVPNKNLPKEESQPRHRLENSSKFPIDISDGFEDTSLSASSSSEPEGSTPTRSYVQTENPSADASYNSTITSALSEHLLNKSFSSALNSTHRHSDSLKLLNLDEFCSTKAGKEVTGKVILFVPVAPGKKTTKTIEEEFNFSKTVAILLSSCDEPEPFKVIYPDSQRGDYMTYFIIELNDNLTLKAAQVNGSSRQELTDPNTGSIDTSMRMIANPLYYTVTHDSFNNKTSIYIRTKYSITSEVTFYWDTPDAQPLTITLFSNRHWGLIRLVLNGSNILLLSNQVYPLISLALNTNNMCILARHAR